MAVHRGPPSTTRSLRTISSCRSRGCRAGGISIRRRISDPFAQLLSRSQKRKIFDVLPASDITELINRQPSPAMSFATFSSAMGLLSFLSEISRVTLYSFISTSTERPLSLGNEGIRGRDEVHDAARSSDPRALERFASV